jgi:hypothetical protein
MIEWLMDRPSRYPAQGQMSSLQIHSQSKLASHKWLVFRHDLSPATVPEILAYSYSEDLISKIKSSDCRKNGSL